MVDWTIALKGTNPNVGEAANKGYARGINVNSALINQRNAVADESRASAKFQDYQEDRQALEAYRADPSAANRQRLPIASQSTLQGMDKAKAEYDELTAQYGRDKTNRRLAGAGRLSVTLMNSTKEGDEGRITGWSNGIDDLVGDGLMSAEDGERYKEMPPTDETLRQIYGRVLNLQEYQKATMRKPGAFEEKMGVLKKMMPDATNRELIEMGKGGVQVHVDTGSKKVEGTSAEKLLSVVEKADVTREVSDKFRQLSNIMQTSGLYTGKLAQPIASVKQALSDIFGFDIEGTDAAQLLDSSNKAAAAIIKEQFKDARMNAGELVLYRSIPSNITNSKRGGELIAKMAEQDTAYRVADANKALEFLGEAQESGNYLKALTNYYTWRQKQKRWTKDVYIGIRKLARKDTKNIPLLSDKAWEIIMNKSAKKP